MGSPKKILKIYSLVILGLAVLTLTGIILELRSVEVNNAILPDGAPEIVLDIAKGVIVVISLVFLLPQLYLGIKGLCVAENPDSSRGHIICSMVLFVLNLLALVAPIISIVTQDGDPSGVNFRSIVSTLASAAVYYEYHKYAKKVYEEN